MKLSLRDQFALTPERLQALWEAEAVPQIRVPTPIGRKRQHFVKMPVPWFETLVEAGAGADTYRLALQLLYIYWRDGQPVLMSNVRAKAAGVVGRTNKWRALRELERLGLVRVERRGPGRAPRATPLKL